jgi:hypothetical protein
MKHKFSLLSALLASSLAIQAQDAQVSAGDEGSGAGGTSSYSIGIAVYTSYKSDSGWVNQGVQQAYDEVLSSSVDPITSGIDFTVYPNPTLSIVHLQTENAANGNYSYGVMDASGKMVLTDKVQSAVTPISLHELSSGMYFIKVWNNEQEVQSFKIMKYE